MGEKKIKVQQRIKPNGELKGYNFLWFLTHSWTLEFFVSVFSWACSWKEIQMCMGDFKQEREPSRIVPQSVSVLALRD